MLEGGLCAVIEKTILALRERKRDRSKRSKREVSPSAKKEEERSLGKGEKPARGRGLGEKKRSQGRKACLCQGEDARPTERLNIWKRAVRGRFAG